MQILLKQEERHVSPEMKTSFEIETTAIYTMDHAESVDPKEFSSDNPEGTLIPSVLDPLDSQISDETNAPVLHRRSSSSRLKRRGSTLLNSEFVVQPSRDLNYEELGRPNSNIATSTSPSFEDVCLDQNVTCKDDMELHEHAGSDALEDQRMQDENESLTPDFSAEVQDGEIANNQQGCYQKDDIRHFVEKVKSDKLIPPAPPTMNKEQKESKKRHNLNTSASMHSKGNIQKYAAKPILGTSASRRQLLSVHINAFTEALHDLLALDLC